MIACRHILPNSIISSMKICLIGSHTLPSHIAVNADWLSHKGSQSSTVLLWFLQYEGFCFFSLQPAIMISDGGITYEQVEIEFFTLCLEKKHFQKSSNSLVFLKFSMAWRSLQGMVEAKTCPSVADKCIFDIWYIWFVYGFLMTARLKLFQNEWLSLPFVCDYAEASMLWRWLNCCGLRKEIPFWIDIGFSSLCQAACWIH